MPIAFAVGAVALAFMFVFMPAANVAVVAETIYSELDNFTLLTIPLFVLMGAAIGKSRAGEDLYASLNRWLSRVPGGLGVANVLACSVFAAMCGSSPATCSAIGSSGIPQMRARGYSEELATGLIAAGGTLGILIPPSLTLILYGLAAEQSIGKLFMAGVGPGLLLTAMFIGLDDLPVPARPAARDGGRVGRRTGVADARALHVGASASRRCRASSRSSR